MKHLRPVVIFLILFIIVALTARVQAGGQTPRYNDSMWMMDHAVPAYELDGNVLSFNSTLPMNGKYCNFTQGRRFDLLKKIALKENAFGGMLEIKVVKVGEIVITVLEREKSNLQGWEDIYTGGFTFSGRYTGAALSETQIELGHYFIVVWPSACVEHTDSDSSSSGRRGNDDGVAFGSTLPHSTTKATLSSATNNATSTTCPTQTVDPAAANYRSEVPRDEIHEMRTDATLPILTHSVVAEFTEEARKSKYQGVVIVGFVVDIDGQPKNIKVEHSLGMGLDEKAIEAVRQFRFLPGKKDCEPVPTRFGTEVNFRLY